MKQIISIEHTDIDGLLLVQPQVFFDPRGYFVESYNQQRWNEAGISTDFVQDNESQSKKGVLRGLHLQVQHPQTKLIRVALGRIFDVAVDIRRGSKTFGKWFGTELSGDNKRQLFIPEGFAHGFLTLSDIAIICYKVSDYYHPEDERCIIWNDETIGVKWPDVQEGARTAVGVTNATLFDGTPILVSEKDSRGESWLNYVGSLN